MWLKDLMGRSVGLPDLANNYICMDILKLKKLFTVYQKFKFIWVSLILFGNSR